MTVALPENLYTAIGTFQGGPDLRVDVAVPNFPTRQEAEDYARAFRIKLADGLLLRDDGMGSGLFDETSREVLDSQVAVSRKRGQEGSANAYEPASMTIAQLAQVPALNDGLAPVAWHVEEERR